MAANKRLGPVTTTRLVIVSVVDAAERGEPVNRAQLARTLGVSPHTVKRAIASAVAQGLVERMPSERGADGRWVGDRLRPGRGGVPADPRLRPPSPRAR